MKFAPEGYPFIAVFMALTAIAAVAFGPRWAVIPLVVTLFMLYFFRDPERIVPAAPGFISPADGKIIVIKRMREDEYLKADSTKISIFMSPLNVHVNRAPCDGTVVSVKHTPGGFSAAYKEEASLRNENIAMVLRCADGPELLVRQIAGFIARRAVCRVRPGDSVKRGERYGMIKFSSRLDVYLPPDMDVKVKLDDTVRAGETILAVAR